MIKLITIFYRKPGMTLEQFDARWLDVHGPLVQRIASDLHVRRYVQSHRTDSTATASFTGPRGWSTNPPDGCVELWYDSMEDFIAGYESAEGRAATALLIEDESQFIDMTRSVAWFTEEHTLVG